MSRSPEPVRMSIAVGLSGLSSPRDSQFDPWKMTPGQSALEYSCSAAMEGADREILVAFGDGSMSASPPERPPRLLTIAGSDSGGGAGIQADLKTFAALQSFGMSVITAVTAQNTVGVQGVEFLSAGIVAQQLDSVLSDLGADAVKTGMLGSREIVEVTAAKLAEHSVAKVVIDPVMVSSSGHALLQPDAVESYKAKLFPLATVITPNVKEAEHLLGFAVKTLEDTKRAARELHAMGPKWVLVKGGDKHSERDDEATSTDVLFDGTSFLLMRAPRILDTRNVHGTGCTLASAIAVFLAQDAEQNDVPAAVTKAKTFITELLLKSKGLDLGTGVQGPMHHASCARP